jgi:DNA modification methylase
MKKLEIVYIRIRDLRQYSRNARTHSKKQIRQIADSIKRYGFTNPLIIDNDNNILAGHGRLTAAELLGMDLVPCVRLEHMSPSQKKAYVLADNKLALNAGWDDELLALELKELLAVDDGFDIATTGFTISEVDELIEGLNVEEQGSPRDDQLPALSVLPPTAKLGDIWQLGRHRLICGSALDDFAVQQLMAGELAQMVFTDPPYNEPIAGHVSGLGKVQHSEFAMAAGEMDKAQFIGFLSSAFQNLVNASTDGSIHYICMDWRHMQEILEAGEKTYTELKNLLVWAKDNGGMGTFYRSRHELIFAFKKGTAPHINSFELGQHGRYRTNVWNYKGMNSFGGNRDQDLALHPTVKPVAMIADAIKDVSKRGDIVLDLFGGSGSTLIAAHKTGRRGYVCEIDPVYCDRIVRRWQSYAKDDAILLKTGETFDAVEVTAALGTMDFPDENLTQNQAAKSNAEVGTGLTPAATDYDGQSSPRYGNE